MHYLFTSHYTRFTPSLENLARKEREITALNPDLVTATAFSALNQAFSDLLAKREQVPSGSCSGITRRSLACRCTPRSIAGCSRSPEK
jgi:hypothetical protein